MASLDFSTPKGLNGRGAPANWQETSNRHGGKLGANHVLFVWTVRALMLDLESVGSKGQDGSPTRIWNGKASREKTMPYAEICVFRDHAWNHAKLDLMCDESIVGGRPTGAPDRARKKRRSVNQEDCRAFRHIPGLSAQMRKLLDPRLHFRCSDVGIACALPFLIRVTRGSLPCRS